MKSVALSIILLIAINIALSAVPARTGVYTYSQPNGFSFKVRMAGDEFNRIVTTVDGAAIILDKDGYYSYATYDAECNSISSGVHVGSNDSSEAAQMARNIPYASLNRKAAAMKAAVSGNRTSIHIDPLTKSGNITKALIILAEFKDLQFKSGNAERFNAMLNENGYSYNGATGSARDYFESQFGDNASFEFVVTGPVTLSKNYSYYGENGENGYDINAVQAVAEACKLADSQIDFSEFDNDNDGMVDNVFIFVAGGDEAEGAGEDHIWSHRWYIREGAGIKLTLDGKTINSYAISTELSSDGSTGKQYFKGIGTFCHEFSHVLGLHDMYDTDYEMSGGRSNTLWGLSVMDSGCYHNNGNTPPNYNALELESFGIGRVEMLKAGSWEIEPLSRNKTYARYDGKEQGEYYLFECRKKEGWDTYIGGNGLVIYHVDKTEGHETWSESFAKNLTAKQRWEYNEVNCRPSHQCMDLIETKTNPSSVENAFWPSANQKSFSESSSPSFEFWNGDKAEIALTNIKLNEENGNVSFYVAGAVSIEKTEVFQDAAIVQWRILGGKQAKSTISISSDNGFSKSFEVSPYTTGMYSYTFENLEQKTSYKVTVTNKDNSSRAYTEFTTKAFFTDSYPFIYLNSAERDSEGYFKKDSTMPLRLFNLKKADKVKWTFNGVEITDDGSGYYTVKQSGTLKAHIYYSDGSKEIISKTIEVQ